MQVRIIGSSGGVALGFKATSFLIDGKLLLDAGSVATGLLLEEQLRIEHILISHAHLDHISELAFLCDNCLGVKQEGFQVYSHDGVKKAIMKYIFNNRIWPDFSKLPNHVDPIVKFNAIKPKVFLQLGEFQVLPILVNHTKSSLGFIIRKGDSSILFTSDTGPASSIWKEAKKLYDLKAIFTEVSFPNRLQKIATISNHHTANSLKNEIEKMPDDIPVFVGHLKPGYQKDLHEEINAICSDRITVLGANDTSYVF